MEKEVLANALPADVSPKIIQAKSEVVAQQTDTNWMDGYEWVCRTLVEKPSINLQ